MKKRDKGWIAVWVVIVAVTLALMLHDNHWSMVYEAVQTPEVPGGQKRLVLFNEDGLTRWECADLFDEHLRRLNNNVSVIEYEIGCGHLRTRGRGTKFQYQNQWLIP